MDLLVYKNYLESFMTKERVQKIHTVLMQRTDLITVCVEDIYQLHNTSAVMRSCDIFGIQSLHVISQKYGKKIDTEIAMGAQKWVDIYRYDQTSDAISSLKQKNYKIIATTPQKNATPIQEFKVKEKTAFFFGTERKGLSDEVFEQADDFVHIPMVGFTESLNVSVSASIILQQLSHQLRSSDLNWNLSENEYLLKTIQWYEHSIKNIDSIQKVFLNRINK